MCLRLELGANQEDAGQCLDIKMLLNVAGGKMKYIIIKLCWIILYKLKAPIKIDCFMDIVTTEKLKTLNIKLNVYSRIIKNGVYIYVYDINEDILKIHQQEQQ